MLLHVFKDVSCYLIVLSQLNLAQFINIMVAPIKFLLFIHAHCFARDVLHNGNYFLSCLTVINCILKSLVGSLAPQSHEGSQISFVVWIWQVITGKIFVLNILLVINILLTGRGFILAFSAT